VLNALTAASGYAQLLLRRWTASAEAPDRPAVEAVLANLTRAARLLESEPRRRAPGDLRELVAQAAYQISPGRRSDLLVVLPTTEPVLGWWNEDRLLQVLANLLDNAAKYSRPGTPIHVELRRVGQVAQIAVQDQGIGIEAIELERIFAGHRTADARRLAAGSGIGLRLSRRLIAAEGGRLWVTSRPGIGSTFTIEMPLADGERVAGGWPV